MTIAAQVRSDKDTIAKLKIMAGGIPVAQFLRDLANGKPAPVSKIEAKLDKIIDDLSHLSDDIDILNRAIRRLPGGNDAIDAR